MTNRMPELLCPAGNLESLEAALHFGADAVYGGMKQFGLRAFAGNFDEEALTQAVEKMHGAGKKFYLTMNIFPFDDQLDDFIAAAKAARDIGVDAAIVADPATIGICRDVAPRSAGAAPARQHTGEHRQRRSCARLSRHGLRTRDSGAGNVHRAGEGNHPPRAGDGN